MNIAPKEKEFHLALSMNSKKSNKYDHEFTHSKSSDGIPFPRVWIEAYGCSANVADSQAIAGALSANGFEIAEPDESHDLNIIVTCSVKDTTEHKMMSRIKALSMTGKPLIIAGCLAKTETEKLQRLFSGASFLGPRSLTKTVSPREGSNQWNKVR